MANKETDTTALIPIEVAFAKPDEQVIIAMEVPQQTTLAEAVQLSGIVGHFPEIAAAELKVGIFGSACLPDQTVRSGDRIEVYRPLIRDPKEARRQRALKK